MTQAKEKEKESESKLQLLLIIISTIALFPNPSPFRRSSFALFPTHYHVSTYICRYVVQIPLARPSCQLSCWYKHNKTEKKRTMVWSA